MQNCLCRYRGANVINALAAISIARGWGSCRSPAPAEGFRAPHRLIAARMLLVIDDTYNANPASMRAVLRLPPKFCTGAVAIPQIC